MKLYPYQEAGVAWLAAHQRGGLFDDQGLGKTAQAIVAADRIGAKRVLVVAPTVALLNWQREFAQWSPSRRVQIVTSGRARVDATADVVLVTHGLSFVPYLNAQLRGFALTIIDEAHAFRTPNAKRTRAVYLGADALVRRSPAVWALTGTPMVNDPREIWTALAGISPNRLRDTASGKLLTYAQWRDRFCVLQPTDYGVRVVGVQNVPELKQRLAGFGFRRLKSEVLTELPALRFATVPLATEPVADEPDDAGDIEADPTAFATWRRKCGLAKVEPAVELLRDDFESGMGKAIVVAHHRDVVDGLVRGLADYNPALIDGSASSAQRQFAVDQFQNDPQCRCIVLNILAGGVAITLTAATDVVFVEQSFVPGENRQVMDRAHRIGQRRSVLVRYLFRAGSVDEKLVEILARKTAMLTQVGY